VLQEVRHVRVVEELIILNTYYDDKREECTAAGGVMEYGVVRIAESLVCNGSMIRLVGQLLWSCKGNISIQVHGGLGMDDFKVACIFVEVKFVRYV